MSSLTFSDVTASVLSSRLIKTRSGPESSEDATVLLPFSIMKPPPRAPMRRISAILLPSGSVSQISKKLATLEGTKTVREVFPSDEQETP